jgi:hypothetical protein
MYIDDLRAKEEGVHEEKPLPEAPKPPENLVSPETHDKLLEDLDKPVDEKKSEPPVKEEKEPTFTPKDIMEIPEEKESSKKCPKCGEDIWDTSTVDQRLNKCWNCGTRFDNPEAEASLSNEIARADNAEIRKVATKKVALQLWERASNYMGDDLSDYYMGPAIGYEKEPLEVSNFKVALEMLGGEGNGVLVGNFGGFGGGYEQIFVHKDAADKVAILQDIENKLQGYPVLDDSDYSEAQMEEEQESYNSWAKQDALRIIDEELHRQNPDLQGSVSELELSPEIEHKLSMVVFDDLSYGDGTALHADHLIKSAEEEGLLNDFRNALSGKEAIPENPNQMKLFETSLKHKLLIKALHKRALNPLQEPPVVEKPTDSTPPSQDTVPMGSVPHPELQKGDRVAVVSDLGSEEAAFEGTYISDYVSKGNKYNIIQTDDLELVDVPAHRVSKISEGTSPEPAIEPNIQKPEEPEISVTPKLEDLHSSLKNEATGGKCGGCEKDLPAVWGKTYCKECVDKAESKGESPLKREELYNEAAGEKYYVGISSQKPDWEVFTSVEKPTQEKFPYNAVIGPFRTRRGAEFMAQHGRNNPHLQTVEDAERISGEEVANPFLSEKKESSLDDIKAEVKNLEAQLDNLGRTIFCFPKDGIKKVARPTNSAFEGDGWVRVWIDQDDIDIQPEYKVALKLPDENSRIDALKEIALKLAYSQLEEAKERAGVYASFNFDSLVPSEHDRIDWVSLANSEQIESSLKVKAEDPVPAKTEFKDLKKAPDYVDPKSAVPASPDMEQVLVKMESLQNKLSILDQAKEKIKMAMQEELKKIDVGGERSQIEKELQDSYEKLGILIDATESKVINWSEKLYTLQHQEKEVVPQPTTGELLSKIYAKFDGAEKYVESVLNGFKALAKKLQTKRLVRWPDKRSSLEPVTKEASVMDDLNQLNEEMLKALQELS